MADASADRMASFVWMMHKVYDKTYCAKTGNDQNEVVVNRPGFPGG